MPRARARRRWWGAGVLLLLAGSVAPVQAGHGSRPNSVPSRYPEDVKSLLDAGQAVVLVDVRPGEAYRQGHLPGARNVPFDDLGRRLRDIPKAGVVVLYGTTRFEARRVFDLLRMRGYDNLSVLEDGFGGWVRRGFPVDVTP
jgi:rhodanese-related sulfurtransferase